MYNCSSNHCVDCTWFDIWKTFQESFFVVFLFSLRISCFHWIFLNFPRFRHVVAPIDFLWKHFISTVSEFQSFVQPPEKSQMDNIKGPANIAIFWQSSHVLVIPLRLRSLQIHRTLLVVVAGPLVAMLIAFGLISSADHMSLFLRKETWMFQQSWMCCFEAALVWNRGSKTETAVIDPRLTMCGWHSGATLDGGQAALDVAVPCQPDLKHHLSSHSSFSMHSRNVTKVFECTGFCLHAGRHRIHTASSATSQAPPLPEYSAHDRLVVYNAGGHIYQANLGTIASLLGKIYVLAYGSAHGSFTVWIIFSVIVIDLVLQFGGN